MTEELTTADALAQLSFLVHGALSRRAAEHDLSVVQARLLGILRDRTPTMAQLATALGIDKSSVTGLVDRASARGLMTRVPSEHDGRVVEVVLTDRGELLVAEVQQVFEADVAGLVAGLTDAQRGRLTDLASSVVLAAR